MVRKDLLLFFTDRRAVIMSFAAPIAIASFFGFIFSGSEDTETARVPVRVVDQDRSVISKAIVQRPLRGQDARGDRRHRRASRARRCGAARRRWRWWCPRVSGTRRGRPSSAAARSRSSSSSTTPRTATELAMVRGILTEHVMQAVSAEMFGGDQGRRLTQQSLEQLKSPGAMPEGDRRGAGRHAGRGEPLVRARPGVAGARRVPARPRAASPCRTPCTRRRSPRARASPTTASPTPSRGWASSSCSSRASTSPIGMLLERQLGPVEAPARRAPLARPPARGQGHERRPHRPHDPGRDVRVRDGRLPASASRGAGSRFLAVCVATAVMASSFGLLIAALGKTPQATRGVAILAVLLMVMLGGAWVPSFVFPAWLQKVTLAIPARWAVDGLDATTWRGASLRGHAAHDRRAARVRRALRRARGGPLPLGGIAKKHAPRSGTRAADGRTRVVWPTMTTSGRDPRTSARAPTSR